MNSDQELSLYQHSRRPTWGIAILAWEGGDKRRYQFQDGRLRTFKRGYYHLFDPVDRPIDVAAQIADELSSKLYISRGRRDAVVEAQSKGKRLIRMQDQVQAFEHLYPEGFGGPAWLTEVRGRDVERARKRHREPCMLAAQETLSAERLDALLEAGQYEAARDAAREVIRATDLVGPKKLAPIDALEGRALEDFARALRELLHGEGDYDARLTTWLQVLSGTGEQVTWPLATVLPALVHPSDHVVIKPTSFRDQAKWMAPQLKMDMTPSASLYHRLLAMTFRVRMRLEQAGHEPGDLMDVYQFIWTTLRPKSKALIKELVRVDLAAT